MRWVKRRRQQRQCRHLDALGIYGDGIIYMGWRRGWCPDCGLILDDLPYVVVKTDKTPAPCKPDAKGRLGRDPIYDALVGRDEGVGS